MKSYWSAIWVGGIITASVALAPLPSDGQVLKTSAAPVSSAVTANQVEVLLPAQQTLVRTAGGSRLSYHVTRRGNPPRVVLDFDSARLALAENAVPNAYDPIRGLRLGQFRPQQV